ncbi:hypothetical protein [uncultured Ruminococcus sp.]|uniref:hypothetical protein n=1 Tax=uncultured Ruminococcus sp. TaxID=165186 RepID=UPI00266F983C|nr:hypothetical protein [uncultured Ruminococcus sp.]
MIWDLAYNARVEAMRALLTSDNVDLTKKNEVGHDALYMALGNVFFNISEQCEYAIRTYGAATISILLVNDFDDKIKGFDRKNNYYIISNNNNIRTYFAKLAYSIIYAEQMYIDFRDEAPDFIKYIFYSDDITNSRIIVNRLQNMISVEE